MATIVSVILSLLLLSGILYHLYALFCVLDFFRRKEADGQQAAQEPVSIIKPLSGIDPGLGENLKSFAQQDYPEYELLLGFSERDDRTAAKVRRDIVPFLGGSVRVVVSNRELGSNRKVSNLQGMIDVARFQLLAITDSDIRAEPGYLRTVVNEYLGGKNVGMVTCLYKVSCPRSLGSAFESMTIALDFMPSVLVAGRLEGIAFGFGASMLVSKKGLEEIGGLPAIANHIADDYQLGNRLWKKGYQIVLSSVVLETVTGRMRIRDYFSHQLRWARTNRASRPRGIAGYGITFILPLALLLLILQRASVASLLLLGGVLLIRFTTAAVIYRKVIRTAKWLSWLPLLPLKDIASFVIWLWSFFGNTVTWRGRSYKIEKDGKMIEEA